MEEPTYPLRQRVALTGHSADIAVLKGVRRIGGAAARFYDIPAVAIDTVAVKAHE